MSLTTVVRIASSNNFNCTNKEWKQVDHFATNNPDKTFFVNSNIHTPALTSVKKHPYKIVVTVNPNLTIGLHKKLRLKLLAIKDKIAFVRVKYLPETPAINGLIGVLLSQGFPIVITMQRFNSLKTLQLYTDPKYYKYSCSRYRLAGKALKQLHHLVDDSMAQGFPLYICDRKGKGCQTCKLCSTLTTGRRDLKITCLNLSSSGICPYSCCDCYAKRMQHFSLSMGHKPMTFDVIHQNDKQAGRLVHQQKGRAHV